MHESNRTTGQYLKPNQFDRLWLNNFKEVFGEHFIEWPIPFRISNRDRRGLAFKHLPIPPQADLDAEEDLKKQKEYTKADFDSDPKEYIKKAQQKYAGRSFVINTADGNERVVTIAAYDENESNDDILLTQE